VDRDNWIEDPDHPDPALFVSGFQDPTKNKSSKNNFTSFLPKVHVHKSSKIKR
jgi:hypothetical protein